MDEGDFALLPSSHSDGVPRSHGSHPNPPHTTSERCPAPLLLSDMAHRIAPSTFFGAPGTPVSVLNLVTALPLLLSLDRSHYTATMNSAPEGVLDTLTASAARGGGRLEPLSWTMAATDASTAAVRAVLYARGTPSWQAKRRRLRQLALDSFFRSTVSTRISLRRERAPEGGDGVREAVAQLLLHTRTVMSDVSPTQAYLVDFFAAQIMCGVRSAAAAVANSPCAAAAKAIHEPVDGLGGQAPSPASASTAMMKERAKPPFGQRNIMKSGDSASTSATALPHHDRDDMANSYASATIAEQLLYIILRTSIAANTPRRSIVMCGDDTPALLADGLRTPPQSTTGTTALTSTPLSMAWPSVVGNLTRTKSRLDDFNYAGPAMLSSKNEQSIYHYSNSAGAVRPAAALPYQPYCWLAPSTVALVERSQALRRQQRWTCDLDPVVEATIAGKGLCTRSSHLSGGAGTRFTAVVSLLDSVRSSWTPLPGMADSDDAAALTALVHNSGLPFATTSPSAALNVAREARPATRFGGFHWGQAMVVVEDPAVEALFAADCAHRISSHRSEADGVPDNEEATPTKQHEAESVTAALPACRTPFVSCQPLYDRVLYAQVHLALHWCTAGLADPFCLTDRDNTAGPNLPALRVRKEFYARPLQTKCGAGTAAAVIAISGLASLLEWGCYYGTLLRRLHRLCDLADDVTLRGTLGSYGRCAMNTLRLLLCLLRRQIGELADQAGGPHELSFAELLTAQQRLQRAVEQVEVLAAFFGVPAAAAAPATLRHAPAAPETWDPFDVLQDRCSSALLLSRLYECFSARHVDALGQHGSTATHYHELQQERLAEMLISFGGEGSDETPLQVKTWGGGVHQQRQKFGAALAAVESGTAPPRVEFSPLGADNKGDAWELQRKELLSDSIDAIGILLRAVLRPLNTMLHRWLTAGELADPYDEFFVVSSHGQTHSGFALEPSPQRLPVFLSVAAATDLLQAGVSLRVLRAAASQVVLSAQKDARRLEAMAEVNEAAAEDYAEELLDTQTLRRAIEQFIERLVHGAPTADAAHGVGRAETGANDDGDAEDAALLPLLPRVDVMSSYGAINWWKEHYKACTGVLLEMVEAANPREGGGQDSPAEAAPDPSLWLQADEEAGLCAAGEAAAGGKERADDAASSETHTGRVDTSLLCSTAARAACDAGKGEPDDHHLRHFPHDAAVFPPKESMGEVPSYVTIFMNSDEEEDHGVYSGMARAANGRQEVDNASLASSSPRSSTTATSVLGLRRIAGSRFSTGTAVSSTTSSRGTMALYGAITEELRQVSLLEQQTETDLGQSRHTLRAEFDAQLWRRRREGRLSDWKAQRLALRLRRVRAMESIVDELRDMYMIRAVGHAEVQEAASHSVEETEQHGTDGEPFIPGAAMAQMRAVVPLHHLPPSRVAPPVILYAVPDYEDGVDGVTGGRRGSRAFASRPRRTSFAANPTIVELPATSGMRRRVSTHDTLQSYGRKWRSLSASALFMNNCPRPPGSPPLSGLTPRRGSAAPASTRGVALTDALSDGASVQKSEGGGVGPAVIRQLRDVDPAALSAFGVMEKRGLVGPAHGAVASFARPSASTLWQVPLSQSSQQRCEQVEAAILKEHAEMVAAVATDEAHAEAVRRDELGYAHPDALFRVADINDDEFLLMRTGPKSYARREAEEAALAELAARQAQLAACTVDDPEYLRQLAAAAAVLTDPCCNGPKDSTAVPKWCLSAQKFSSMPTKTERDAAACDDRAEEDVGADDSATQLRRNADLPPALDSAWQQDDPQRVWREVRTSMTRTAAMGKSFTDELWSWTAGEAHRWYFDDLTPLHHVLIGAEVDRALLVDLALTCDEAEALQRCSGYYRALGQYTANFLTHKALQLTLLPPYGSLYRLTTQFLDVCLLQKAPIAMRLMDVWIACVDTALEVMAEAEEPAMVHSIIMGETRLSALAALKDTRQGVTVADALSSLNSAFQREWATCVTNGELTVKLEWRLTSKDDEGHEQLDSSGKALESVVGFTEGDGAAEEGSWNASRASRLPHQSAPSSHDNAEKVSRSLSPIQSFLASLSLVAVSPWCSGAWLLPDHMLHCTGAIFRTLLFWKSAERIVLHAWRTGMDSGIPSVFFFCSVVRQVLVSSLQETLWGRLVELTTAYRKSLQFEAGVLYTYSALESFTIDHAAFLRECEFYMLCGPQFQRHVRPVLQAMVNTVEEVERALRLAQVSIRVARRQYMATFYFMVKRGSSSSSSGSDSDESAEADCCRETKERPTVMSAPRHVFTPSRWSRRARMEQDVGKVQGSDGVSRASPWYLRPLEDALAHHSKALSPPEATGSELTVATAHDTNPKTDLDSARTPPRGAAKGKRRRAAQAERSPSSALSSATTARSSTPVVDKSLFSVMSAAGSGEETRREGNPAPAAVSRKKRRRGGSQPVGVRRPTAGAAASTAMAPWASAAAPRLQTRRYSWSAGRTTRQSAASAPAPASPATGAAITNTSVMKRPCRSRHHGKRLSSAKREERRIKLRAIAERKIKEEVEHQHRLMRDMASLHLRRFALLTQSLRDALAEVMVKENVKGMEEESIAAAAAAISDGASLKSIKDLHKAQRQHMNRYAYISTVLQRLDALIEVMATQV
ncbi:Gamma tubulin complex component N-terminal, putative [Leishmania shawi]|uniref:Gamma tubulin complex component N-terminal n=1 Tax=Leishmania shawi TaxID=5680 RepID=A0ABR3DV05_9TRYP